MLHPCAKPIKNFINFGNSILFDIKMSENFNSFVQMDLSKYLGEWVAISENRVVGHSKDINDLKKQFKRIKGTSLITKIPRNNITIF